MSEQLTQLINNLNEIKQEKDTKIIPENIKKGVTIFDVTGELDLDEIEEIVDDILGTKPEPELLIGFSGHDVSDSNGYWEIEDVSLYKKTEDSGYLEFKNLTVVDGGPYNINGRSTIYYSNDFNEYNVDITTAEGYQPTISKGEMITLRVPVYNRDLLNADYIDPDYQPNILTY